MKDLESVTKALQCEWTKPRGVRGLFDAVIEKYPETGEKLTQSAKIVHSTMFEGSIVKVQIGSSSSLSPEEKVLLRPFIWPDRHSKSDGDEQISFA